MTTAEILQYIFTPVLVGIFAILSSAVTVYLTSRQDRKRWEREQKLETQKWEREQQVEQQKWERAVAIEDQKQFALERTDAAKQCVQALTEYLQSPAAFLSSLSATPTDADAANAAFMGQVNVKHQSAVAALFYLMTYFPSDHLTPKDENFRDNIYKFSYLQFTSDDIHKKDKKNAWSESQKLAFNLRVLVIGFLRRSKRSGDATEDMQDLDDSVSSG